jgi:hypothetical protein
MNMTKKSISLLLLASLAIASCESDERTPQASGELSKSVESFLGMQQATTPLSSPSTGRQLRNSVSKSFQLLQRATGRMRSDTVPDDTTGNVGCAEIKTKYNHDGSVTTTVDYGDGCEEGVPPYVQFLYGLHQNTFKSSTTTEGTVTTNSFYADNTFKNFGGHYTDNGQLFEWMNDGTSTDEGYSRYNSADNSFSGVFAHSAHITSVWNGQAFFHKGASRTAYNATESVLESSDFTYTTNGDNYFRVQVVEPLVTRFACQSDTLSPFPPVPVSGIQSVRYKNGDEQGSFEIHYGNGECDTIVTIVEKGKHTKVNLSNFNPIARKD